MGDDPLPKGPGLGVVGHVAQELDYPGHEAKLGRFAIALPVVDGGPMDADLCSHLSLKEPAIEPFLSEMVSQGA